MSDAPQPRILIEHLEGARKGDRQTFSLDTPEIRFGRHAECEVRFDVQQDLDASSRHAVLKKVGSDWELSDVGSSSGTFRQGQKVPRVLLRPNRPEDVQFGRGGPRCRILIEDPSAPAAGPDEEPPRTRVNLDASRPSIVDPKQPGTRTVSFLRSLVDETVDKRTRRLRVIIVALSAALVIGAAVVVLFATGVLGKKGFDATRVGKEYRNAIFLVIDTSTGSPLCTAFAVAPHLLATNSHCTIGEQGQNRTLQVVRNGKPEDRYTVVQEWRHPSYEHKSPMPSSDVALLRVEEDLGARVTLGNDDGLHHLAAGDRVFSYGFPGTLANPAKPEATMTEGMIGRVTRLDGVPGEFEENRLVQHSAYTTGGTSGSPVFDTQGHVIAISAGHYTSMNVGPQQDVNDGQTRMVGTVQELMGYSFGIRIDTLAELLEDHADVAGP